MTKPTTMKKILEICAADIDSVYAAARGGADRVELCCALSEGGLTPSAGMIEESLKVPGIKVNVLIRPRSGDFIYSEAELRVMIRNIEMCRQLGVNGVVFGALTPNGDVDKEACRRMADASDGLHETSILSTTGRGYYVLALLKANHEPSNHVIRDLAEASARLEQSGCPILLLTEGDEGDGFGIELKDFPPLPSTVSLGRDSDGSILEGIREGVNISGDDLPILIVADTFNRVVFISQGYTIGIGDKLTSLLRKLKN